MAADSKRLQNVLTRHQAYLEGVKVYYAFNFTRVIQALTVELRKLFGRLQYDTMDGLTKAQLNAFVRQLKDFQQQHYDKFIVSLLNDLESFMEVDLDVTRVLFSSLARKGDETETNVQTLANEFDDVLAEDGDDKNGVYAASLIAASKSGNDRLWRAVANSPIPASGSLLTPFLIAFVNSATANVLQQVMRGYADRATVAATLASITGTPSRNFKDGSMNRVTAQGSAVIDSAIQHVDAIIQNAVASMFYSRYQWIAIIDGATTEICRSRNRKIYEYGKGPLPPAHIHCRSKAVPYVGIDAGLQAYGAWIKSQPARVREDFGETKLNVSRLSLKQFSAKLSLMLLGDDDEA